MNVDDVMDVCLPRTELCAQGATKISLVLLYGVLKAFQEIFSPTSNVGV